MLLASTSSGEGLPVPHLPRHLEWGVGVNCTALASCQVSGAMLGLSSQELPIRGLDHLGASPVLQGRTSMRKSHLERAARRQVLPCFGRLERATASHPMPPPKTATLAQLLPWVSVEICQLVGGPDAWAGHLPCCNGPGLSGCPWALAAARTGRKAGGQDPSLTLGGATRVGPASHQQPPCLLWPACGWREQAKLLLPAPAVCHLAVPVKPVTQPGLDPAARSLPGVPDSLSCWLVVRQRLSCPRSCRAPVSIRDRPKAEGWDKAVGTQHLGDCLGSSEE